MDRYQVEEVLGRGGMATVHRAWDPVLEVDRAIKILNDEWADYPDLRARFLREARLMARLSHPNLVTVFDAGEAPEGLFLVMELIEGGNLASHVKTSGTLSPDEAVQVVDSVLRALEVVHAAGVVHRDVKPSNILRDAEGRVRLADFGIAQSSASDLTRTGATMGTQSFMSPEQHTDPSRVDARADVFAAGATLFWLLTGSSPFGLFQMDDSSDPRLAPIAPELRPIVFRACRFHPDDRYGSAAEMRRALTPGTGPTGRPVDRAPTAKRSLRPLALAGVGGLALGALALGMVLGGRWSQGSTRSVPVSASVAEVADPIATPSVAPELTASAAPEPVAAPSPPPTEPAPKRPVEGIEGAALVRTFVNSLPPSTLRVDGARVGTTPWVGELTPGAHRLQFDADSGEVEHHIMATGEELRVCRDLVSGGSCPGG